MANSRKKTARRSKAETIGRKKTKPSASRTREAKAKRTAKARVKARAKTTRLKGRAPARRPPVRAPKPKLAAPSVAPMLEATDLTRGAVALHAPVGASLRVDAVVDNNHRVPYAVAFDGIPIIDETVSKSATMSPTPGRHALTWRFIHDFDSPATWSHELTATVSGQPPVVLDKKSSVKGDPSNSSGGIDYEVS